ncbi:MAG: hypothetical protein AAF229_04610 [Pseudomonadota bacterium]
MNQGVIVGVVKPLNKTIVRFDGVWAGRFESRLNVFNAKSGIANNLGLIRPGADDCFAIPFAWDPRDIGDFIESRFRVSGFDSTVNRFDTCSGQLHVGRDWRKHLARAASDFDEDSLWAIAQTRLATACEAVLCQSLQAKAIVAIGAAQLRI